MEIEAGPSRPKRPRNEPNYNRLNNEETVEFLLEDDDTDDDFALEDEEESSSDDDDQSQPLTLQPPIHYRGIQISEIESPLSHQDLETTDRPSTSGSTSSWTPTGELESLDFTEENVFNGPHNGDPVDYFNLFFDDAFLRYICDQSNEQATKLFLSEKTTEESRITRWKDLTVEELKIFLGLLFHMGTIQLTRVQDYWKRDRLFSIPIFSEQMSRNRFLIIMRCLHFTSETSSEDPLYKIRFVIDYFNKKMADCYYPQRQLSLDESMILWRGRLLFRQYIKNKRHKYGVKLYMLTEPDGLILKFQMYAGSKDVEVTGKGHAEKIVLHLLEDFLGKGHEVYMDNYYNSVTLAKTLLEKKTFCTGTLQSNLKDNPKEVVQKELKRGENISRFNEGIHVGKWKDKRDVTYITTQYPNCLIPVKNKSGQVREKPRAIASYNEFMSCVDRQDQLLSFYPCERKTVRWYLKIAIHTFQLLFINSFKMYNKYSKKPKMRLYDYRLAVIDKLLPEKPSDAPQIPRKANPIHTITRITEKASNGRIKRKHCRQCYKQKKRSDTTWHCLACDDKPGLCVECFDLYHAQL